MNIAKYSSWIIYLISLSGIQIAIFPGATVRVFIEVLLFVMLCILAIAFRHHLSTAALRGEKLVHAYFAYSFIVFLYSAFEASSYEEWRYLGTVFLPSVILPVFLIIGTQPRAFIAAVKSLLMVSIPLSFVLYSIHSDDKNSNLQYINYISFVYILIVLLPLFSHKIKFVIFLISILSFGYDVTNRTNMGGIIASYLLLLIYLLIKKFSDHIFIFPLIKGVRLILFVLPVMLVGLGALGEFNIFEYFGQMGNMGRSDGLMISTVDSRSVIYQDALDDAVDTGAWIFGGGVTHTYNTGLAPVLIEYENGRLGGSEVGVLNFMTFGGLLYVILIFLLFYYSSYLAIYKSRSLILKVIGLFISMRWVFLFIENPVALNFYWITIFLCMGVAFSKKFCAMNDLQIEIWFKSLFNLKTIIK